MIYVFLSMITLVLISALLLGIKVLFAKNGRFSEALADANNSFWKKGITWVETQNLQEQNKKNIFEISNSK